MKRGGSSDVPRFSQAARACAPQQAYHSVPFLSIFVFSLCLPSDEQ